MDGFINNFGLWELWNFLEIIGFFVWIFKICVLLVFWFFLINELIILNECFKFFGNVVDVVGKKVVIFFFGR